MMLSSGGYNLLKLEGYLRDGADANARYYNVTSMGFPDAPVFIKLGMQGDIEALDLFLRYGADVNIKDHDDNTVLISAAGLGKYKLAKWLLSRGANINSRNFEDGHSPLAMAAGYGHTSIIELLLQHGSNIEDCNKSGCSILMMAVQQGQLESAKYLISKGAKVNLKAKNGCTILDAAITMGNCDLVELLLSKGAEPNLKFNTLGLENGLMGSTPLLLACRVSSSESRKFLKRIEKETAAKDKEMADVLGSATVDNLHPLFVCFSVDVVKCLLSYGANRYVKTPEGDSCYQLTDNKKIKSIFNRWEVTMLLIVLDNLRVLTSLDPSSFIDLNKFMK